MDTTGQQSGSKLRVLIADDHAFIVHQLARSLRDAGYEVTPAFNGDDAFRYLDTVRFDYLVTDQFMPGKNGLDLVDFICAQGWNTGIILITSHHDNEEVLNRVRSYPKSTVMVKPVSAPKLLAQLAQLQAKAATANR